MGECDFVDSVGKKTEVILRCPQQQKAEDKRMDRSGFLPIKTG
jgi:hypothetical protein